jgi:hypothetical protein
MNDQIDTQKFEAPIVLSSSRATIQLPFDPNTAWGDKPQHHVRGTVNGCPFRGPLRSTGSGYYLSLGAAWLRDAQIDLAAPARVELYPEGPQLDNLAPDIVAALASDDGAAAFFAGLATFYRKNYLRWIESARRPETRAARIAEMVVLLKARKKQR